ncbi:MAG: hypothetical protein U0835_27730 [Isosphaeraceae bacterium]
MGFFDSLKRVLGGHGHDEHHGHHDARQDLARAWGLEDESEEEEEGEAPVEASEYDRSQWVRKLKRVLDGLPETQGEWATLAADAKALGMDAAWIREQEKEEFLMLVRRAVADRKISDAEHRKLDLARDLIGMTEHEAETALHSIAAEASKFFGKKIEGA